MGDVSRQTVVVLLLIALALSAVTWMDIPISSEGGFAGPRIIQKIGQRVDSAQVALTVLDIELEQVQLSASS